MTSLRELLAFNMRENRRALGLSQLKLAEKIDTAPTYIAMIELGKRFPSVNMLERIAAAFGIDPPALFSVNSFQAQSLEALQESVLTDIEDLICGKIKKLREKKQKS